MTSDPSAQITPEELQARWEKGDRPFLLDVRNPDEHAVCRLEGATLIPLGDLPARVGELDPHREIVVHCKMGGRSAQAQQFLRQCGFVDVKNLAGGILAWAERIDPSLPRY